MKPLKGKHLFSHLLKMRKNYVKSYFSLFEEYGSSVFLNKPWPMHIISDPDIIHDILITHSSKFTISNLTMDLKELLGDGIITSDGKHWINQKRDISRAFSFKNISLLENEISDIIKKQFQKKDQSINISRSILQMSYHTIAKIMFDNNLDGNLEKLEHSMLIALQFINSRQASIIKFPMWFPWPSHLKFKKARRIIHSILNKQVENKLNKPDNSLLSSLISKYTDENGVVDSKKLFDQVTTLFVTGHETTANTLIWSIYLLLNNPKFYKEWKRQCLDLNDDSIPSDKDLINLTDCLIMETMRLYPAAPVMPRNALEDISFNQLNIKKGDEILLSIYNLHNSKSYWGNPEKFNPKRFLNKEHESHFLPFGKGKRSCIGEHLAIMEMRLFLIFIGRNFSFESSDYKQMEFKAELTLRPDRDIFIELKDEV